MSEVREIERRSERGGGRWRESKMERAQTHLPREHRRTGAPASAGERVVRDRGIGVVGEMGVVHGEEVARPLLRPCEGPRA